MTKLPLFELKEPPLPNKDNKDYMVRTAEKLGGVLVKVDETPKYEKDDNGK